MMQMLAAAGVPIQQDGIRAADESNPCGYFEWEQIKQLRREPGLIEQCEGKAVKVISSLLMFLPPGFDYRILFMERRIEDVLSSQRRMIARLGARGGSLPEQQMRQALAAHRSQVIKWLQESDYPDLKVEFENLLSEKPISIDQITRFVSLGEEAASAMARVVEPRLRHHGPTARPQFDSF